MEETDGVAAEMQNGLSSGKLMKRPLLEVTADEEVPVSVNAEVEMSDLSSSNAASTAPSPVDPHLSAERSSTVRAALNTIKSIVGVGILSFPFAFMQAGLVAGLVSVVLIAVVVNYGMRILVDVRTEVNKSLDVSLDTSEDVARHVAGRYGYIATIAAICVTQIGIGCAYVLFVANQLYSVQATLNVQEWALCVSPVFVALCWIRNIRALAPVSAFGLIAVGLAVSVVIYEGISRTGITPSEMSVLPQDFFLFFGMAIFAFEGINLAVPVHSNMEKPEQYGRMLNVSFVVIGMLYTSFALLAYSFFLKDTQPIIIQNLTGWIASVVKVLVCLNVAATFPVQLFPVVQLLERAAFGVAEHQISCSSVRTRTFWLRNLLRTGLVLVIVGISIAIPFFEVVVSLVGGLGNGSAGFILPAILHLMVFKGRSPRWRVVANWALLVIGVATVILVTVFGVIKVVHEFQHQGNNTTR